MADSLDTFAPLSDAELAACASQGAHKPHAPEARLICPPDGADDADFAAIRLFKRRPDGFWKYVAADGRTAFYAARWNEANGKKEIRPMSWREGGGWTFAAWPDHRPLYRLDDITAHPNAPIVVCEGEKAADAAAEIFPQSIVTTSSGGSQAAAKTDWKPLAGRQILIWPDNDEAGRKYADEIAAMLAALDCAVSIIDAAALASLNPNGGAREPVEKWDAADATAEWSDLAALHQTAINLAKPHESGPAKATAAEAAPAPLPLAPPSPAAQPYPVDALGPILSGAANSIAAKCQCAPALAAQSVLAVASLAAQRLADVRLPYGQLRPLSLFFVTVAASGDRKSTVDNEALNPVRKHENNLKDAYCRDHEAWRIAHAAWTAEHKKIETDKKLNRLAREVNLSALGRAPDEPIKPLLTAPEPTVEALAKHWPVLPGALGLFSAEGGQMTGGHGFGPDHRLKTAAALSTLWDGSGIRRLRAGDGITDLPGRRLALHLMVQPDAAAAFLSDPILRDQGLLSRLLIAGPETLAGSRLYHELADEMAAPLRRYFACILDLLERPAPAANEAGNELTPRPIELSAEAKMLWVDFHDAIEKRMAPGQSLEGLRDVGAKAAENAARIAGVLTIVAFPAAQEIDAEAMASGCKLMTWYLSEALRLSGVAKQSPALRNALKLSDWLRAKVKTEFALRDILNGGPNVLRTKAAAEQAIAQLEEHGHIERRGEGRGARWIVIRGAEQ